MRHFVGAGTRPSGPRAGKVGVMAARYSVVQTDVRTGNVVKTLPVTGIQFTHSLNAAGTATVGIPLFAPEADPG